MQVFVPYEEPLEVAYCLDARRLNKQILEACQILEAIENPGTSRWENHPIVRMYSNDFKWLNLYRRCLQEYKEYKFCIKNQSDIKYMKSTLESLNAALYFNKIANSIRPSFLTDKLIICHRQRLYTKDPLFYKQWENLGKSDINMYYNPYTKKWLYYNNGKQINSYLI